MEAQYRISNMKIPFALFNSGLLVDVVSNAFSAYSVRRLSVKATYAIQVRRDSDNTTQNIGFSNNDLNVTALLTFCGAANGFVSIWYDQSGNGYHQIQTTNSSQAQIVSSGVLITGTNGKPCLQFSGSQIYSTSGNVTMGAGAVSTFYVTARNWSTNAYSSIISCGYSQNSGYGIVAQTGGGAFDWSSQQTMHVGNGFNTAYSPKVLASLGTMTANAWYLFDSSIGAASSQAYKNGTNISSTSYTATMPSVTATLNVAQDPGYSDNYNGYISEIVNWLTQLPATSQTFARNNINAYYKMY